MATYYSARAADGVQPYVGDTNEFCCAYGSIDLASWQPSDIFFLCKIPSNAVIVGGHFFCGDVDAHASPTASVVLSKTQNGVTTPIMLTKAFAGDAVDEVLSTTLLASGPIQGEGVASIFALATGGAATFQAATMTVVVYYVMP